MQHELRPIAKDAIPRALEKAERYRLLNEPREAESICRDVLAADPQNQDAKITLALAMTDLFTGMHTGPDEARALCAELSGKFEREYYAGVVEERWAKALLTASYPKEMVHGFLMAAMKRFEAAEAVAPAGNDDGVLRWNACVRMIDRAGLAEAAHEGGAGGHGHSFDDDVPAR